MLGDTAEARDTVLEDTADLVQLAECGDQPLLSITGRCERCEVRWSPDLSLTYLGGREPPPDCVEEERDWRGLVQCSVHLRGKKT